MERPNVIRVAWSIVRSLSKTSAPRSDGTSGVDHSLLFPVLLSLAAGGLGEAARASAELDRYLKSLEDVTPDDLSRDEALAFWLNIYNAAAVQLAARAWLASEDSVLAVPGGFRRPVVEIAGETLSLDDIEHGKVRRFGDPRIHSALVCGSLSCPTLRDEPYSGERLHDQLDDQMRSFLDGGGAIPDGDDGVALSRTLLWYGSDFVRPYRMPTLIPASKKAVLEAVRPWLPADLRDVTSVSFQGYDWGLACSVG